MRNWWGLAVVPVGGGGAWLLAVRRAPVWRAPEGPEGLAAVPVGGGGAWLLAAASHAGVEGAGGSGGHGRDSRRGAERSEVA